MTRGKRRLFGVFRITPAHLRPPQALTTSCPEGETVPAGPACQAFAPFASPGRTSPGWHGPPVHAANTPWAHSTHNPAHAPVWRALEMMPMREDSASLDIPPPGGGRRPPRSWPPASCDTVAWLGKPANRPLGSLPALGGPPRPRRRCEARSPRWFQRPWAAWRCRGDPPLVSCRRCELPPEGLTDARRKLFRAPTRNVTPRRCDTHAPSCPPPLKPNS